MDTRSVSLMKTILYEPNIYDYDTVNFWHTETGGPSISGADLRFDGDAAYTKLTGLYGRYRFCIKNAVAPVASQDKIWGLQTECFGNLGSMVFDISEAVFSFQIFDTYSGNLIESFTIPWDSDWTGAYVNFIIDWRPGSVSVAIGLADERPKTFKTWKFKDHSDMPDLPQTVYIKNGNSDNFDLHYLLIRGADQWNHPYDISHDVA